MNGNFLGIGMDLATNASVQVRCRAITDLNVELHMELHMELHINLLVITY